MELTRSLTSSKILKTILIVFIGSIVLTISAKINVPFYPVPMTMQTFVVIFIGMAFGWKLGLATVFAYLVEGAFGLPVFAGTPEKGIGIAYMIGPTGGYLFGFLVAVFIAGFLKKCPIVVYCGKTFWKCVFFEVLIHCLHNVRSYNSSSSAAGQAGSGGAAGGNSASPTHGGTADGFFLST